mgnify:CR=1 FL=1
MIACLRGCKAYGRLALARKLALVVGSESARHAPRVELMTPLGAFLLRPVPLSSESPGPVFFFQGGSWLRITTEGMTLGAKPIHSAKAVHARDAVVRCSRGSN